MKQFKSKRMLFAGAVVLLIVVGLLSFGERARHGHYHFDGGRGWDFAPAASIDACHVNFYVTPRPRVVTTTDSDETLIHLLVLPQARPVPHSVALDAWRRLRPPPQA